MPDIHKMIDQWCEDGIPCSECKRFVGCEVLKQLNKMVELLKPIE